MTYKEFPRHLKAGDTVLLNDGLIELKVEEVFTEDVLTTVISGASLVTVRA